MIKERFDRIIDMVHISIHFIISDHFTKLFLPVNVKNIRIPKRISARRIKCFKPIDYLKQSFFPILSWIMFFKPDSERFPICSHDDTFL